METKRFLPLALCALLSEGWSPIRPRALVRRRPEALSSYASLEDMMLQEHNAQCQQAAETFAVVPADKAGDPGE